MSGPRRAQSDSFVGRREELAAIAGWFGDGRRLVSILGPPGIGKTRLALEYARTLLAPTRTSGLTASGASPPKAAGGAVAPASRGGLRPPVKWQCACDLGEVRDVEELRSAVARALGNAAAKSRSRLPANSSLVRALGARGRGLLVLDNVEQVADGVARVAEEWLSLAPELCILATSRERLRASGEVCLELGPLGLPIAGEPAPSDAVTLFVDRARNHEPRFDPAGDAESIIADVVRALDGIPLAIELAAARVTVMDPEELRRRASAGIDVLSRGVRGAPARQTTLRNAVQWSWDLLTDIERDVLSRCSVFRGGFDLSAAERMLSEYGRRPGVVDILHALRDKSMLRLKRDGGETRFDTYFGIREFAAEKLAAAGGDAESRERHAETYLALAAGVRGEMERSGRFEELQRLTAERDNLMAAYEHLDAKGSTSSAERVLSAIVALEPVLLSRGPVDQLLALIDRFMARPDRVSVQPATYARGLRARARALQLSGCRRGRIRRGARCARARRRRLAACGPARGCGRFAPPAS